MCDRENTTIKCANCGEPHVASYRNCSERVKYNSYREGQNSQVKQNTTYKNPSTRYTKGRSFANACETAHTGQRPTTPIDPPCPAKDLRNYPTLRPLTTAQRPPAGNNTAPNIDPNGILVQIREVTKELEALNLIPFLTGIREMIGELKLARSGLDRINTILKYAPLLDELSP